MTGRVLAFITLTSLTQDGHDNQVRGINVLQSTLKALISPLPPPPDLLIAGRFRARPLGTVLLRRLLTHHGHRQPRQDLRGHFPEEDFGVSASQRRCYTRSTARRARPANDRSTTNACRAPLHQRFEFRHADFGSRPFRSTALLSRRDTESTE